MTFYNCSHCGNVAALLTSGPVPSCCGEKMKTIVPNTVDASREKHVPHVTKIDRRITVQVGETVHPAEEKHHISFIYVETKSGGQRKAVKVGATPAASFAFVDDEPVAAYAYCNLHGLWKCEV